MVIYQNRTNMIYKKDKLIINIHCDGLYGIDGSEGYIENEEACLNDIDDFLQQLIVKYNMHGYSMNVIVLEDEDGVVH